MRKSRYLTPRVRIETDEKKTRKEPTADGPVRRRRRFVHYGVTNAPPDAKRPYRWFSIFIRTTCRIKKKNHKFLGTYIVVATHGLRNAGVHTVCRSFFRDP